jgi:predicted RNA-binding protein (virulence factor B family)
LHPEDIKTVLKMSKKHLKKRLVLCIEKLMKLRRWNLFDKGQKKRLIVL